tara:strand:- start:5185 stop:6420 length:1236 start_codon:yes stop_codon:yes gene_type:complete
MKNKIDLSWNAFDVAIHLIINFSAYFLFLTVLGAANYANFIFISLICGVGQTLAKLGQNDYLVVTKKLSERTISGIFTLNILFAALIFLILVLIFFLIFLLTPRGNIFMVSAVLMSISVFLSISSNTFLAMLQKRQEFKKLFILNLGASLSSIAITFFFSRFVNEIFYPVIFMLGTAGTLLLFLIKSNLFKLKLSKENLITFLDIAKDFMIPLTKTRPIMVATKNIDTFMVIFIGGDILLVAYNTIKKLLVYPLSILYGILDRWLYPLMAKLEIASKVKKTYMNLSKRIFLASLILSIILINILSLFDFQITKYFLSIGIYDVNIMTLCYGFVLAWPALTLPSLIYPYAKVIKETQLLPRLSIFQALTIFFSLLFIYIIDNHDLVTFGFLMAYLLMNIYIIKVFKLLSFKY